MLPANDSDIAAPAYAELHCLSNFSFLRGASHPHELMARAAFLDYSALAITDECSVAGVVRAHIAAKEYGLKLIVGTEITLDDGLKLVLLATDREGYGNLCALITRGRTRAVKGTYRLTRDDLQTVDGCLALLIPGAPVVAEHAHFIAACFAGRAWIAVELACGPDDRTRLNELEMLGRRSGLPLVAAGDVHMHVRSRRPLQDVLTASRLGVCVHEAGHALQPNAERHLRPRLRLSLLYPPALLAQTIEIASRCGFWLEDLRYEYPDEIVPQGYTPSAYLRHLTEEGLKRRFPGGVTEDTRKQIEKELDLIAELRYEPFFLTVHDVCQFAGRKGILHQGRGSAANSLVCYALGITAVGPDRLQMLSERFISRQRKNEPPDIDVDFEHQRREEVIQYIYAKYGRDRTAIAATLITYQPRSAVRDVGKALGFEPAQVDRLSKSLAWWDSRLALLQRVKEAGFDPDSRSIQLLIEFVTTVVGFPRHLSQHVGGFVISRGPLDHLVPIENAAMPGRSVIQWDKNDLETLGLIKVDVLALGMLSMIRRALAMVNRQRGSSHTLRSISDEADDPAVYRMIQRADTIGVFQIESRAQMSMLPRLKPRDFYDLVIEIAIVRPGPIQGDMVHPYLKRRQDPSLAVYPSAAVKKVLERTLGVPIFQEQVMSLAMVAAGFSAEDADALRRAMAAWKHKGGLEKFEPMLREGMKKNGYPEEFADQIYKQICGFGEYGFPESHSASFALLAYVSSWLKYYEPSAFLAALLNSQPMGFYSPSALVQDARRHGVEIRPVDVTSSDCECTLEEPSAAANTSPVSDHHPHLPLPAVRLGLQMLNGLSEKGAQRIVAARAQKPFETVNDLAQRAGLNRRDLDRLAAGGALAMLAGHRRHAHWAAAGAQNESSLLREAPLQESFPALDAPSEGANLVADYHSLGLTLGRHPLALLRPRLHRMRLASSAELHLLADGTPARTAGIVTGRQRPGSAKGVVFVTLEDETGYINVVVWESLAEKQRRELLGSRLLGVEGVLQKEGAIVHLIARRLVDHTTLLGRLVTESRDFH